MTANIDKSAYGNLLGGAACMKQVYAMIDRAAKVTMPVLITGETGTGKDLVAYEIHQRSARHGEPYVPLNTGTLSRELMLSELFGHMKGAFTGASDRKIGRFQEADGGTLFLDEISTMEERVQVALLRAIQGGEFRPIGAKQDRKADVRLIAATNEDLGELVARGEFREDLLHRLQVIAINIPPLRERAGDIAPMAMTFLDDVICEYGFPDKRITSDTVDVLRRYSWPGNVRELKNAIAQAALFSDQSAIITVDHLPRRIRQEVVEGARPSVRLQQVVQDVPAGPQVPIIHTGPHESAETPPPQEGLTIPMGIPLDDVQRRYVQAVLDHCGRNKTKAAEILGISRKTLYDKLSRWRRTGSDSTP